MRAVVMAGGEGTRLRPLTSNQPKPMVPIVGKPCMEHILELLAANGFEDVVVTLAFMPQSVRSYFGDGETLGLHVEYSVEEQPLGTAGSVKLAEERLTEPFLVISGDALCDVDLRGMIDAHRATGAAVTIGLKSVDNPLEFGIVVTDGEGRVERFLEKPTWGQVFSDTINTGIYVMEPEVLGHVPPGKPYDFSKELFPHLLELGMPIHGHVLDGYWQDIGNIDQFRQANFDALDEVVHLNVPGICFRGNVWVGEGVEIDAIEHVEGPAFVGANCRLASDAVIGPYAVLGPGVTVREHARVERSIVDGSTYVGRNAVIEGSILGRSCDVRDHVRIHEGAAIGDEVTIGSEASVMPGVSIYPFKEVETGAQVHESIVWETRASSRLFVRDGVTGLVNVDLTPEVAVRVAAALGSALERGARVVASRDSPNACRMIQRALIAGLTSTGVNVSDLRVSPAAITRHVLKTQGLAAGLHVARSASDPELVEIRIFEPPGIQLTTALQKELEKHFSRRELRRASFVEVGETTYPARVRESYAQDLLESIDTGSVLARGLRIVVDMGYSPATFTLPLILGPLGVEVVTINGFFSTEAAAEPTAAAAGALVRSVGADLGAVFDRGAERLLLIDERGEEVEVARVLLLFLKLLAESGRSGSVAVPVTATRLVEEALEGTELRVVRTPHSLSDLTRAAAADGMVFAGGTSGGYVFPDVVPGYDAVTSLCKLLELLARARTPLSELLAGIQVPSVARRSVECPWARKGLVMRLLNEALAGRVLDLTDGIKATDGRGWVQAIPDPDEPLVHVYAEAVDAGGSDALAGEIADLVASIVQGDAAEGRNPELGVKASS